MRSFRTTVFVLAALLLVALPQTGEASSPRVAALQVALKSMKLYKGKVDGVTGPMTKRGVVRLQRKRGLKADGVAGPRTKRALGWRGRPALGSRTIRPGQKGWDVAALQFLLQRGGYGAGRADGVYGKLTRQAVKRAQRAAGIRVDGVAGPKTIAFLRRGGNGGGGKSDPGRVLAGNDPGLSPIAFQRPVTGPIGDGFGAARERGRKHAGLDFPVAQGTAIRASASGAVIFAGYNSGGYGNLVVVQHAHGYTTWYAHMSRVLSSVGQQVPAGTRLGLVGSTGNSTGPHLHFEIRHFDTPLDPAPLLSPEAVMARAKAPVASGGEHGHRQGAHRACAPGSAPSRAGTNWIASEPLCLR